MATIRRNKLSEIHAVFRNRLLQLRADASMLQNAHQGKRQRDWQTANFAIGSLLDVPNLHLNSFNREPINAQYEKVTASFKNAGTVGDVISLKLQLDYNAAEERAYRARHMSLIRAMCIGHGRRLGHGHGNLWSPDKGIEAMAAAYQAAGGVNNAST